MAITTDDFNKIWASTSPLTPYEFSESQYKEGWNFIGGTPPSRQMWDFLQKQNDEKQKYLLDNFDDYLPLSGGTMTGDIEYKTSNNLSFKIKSTSTYVDVGWEYSNSDGGVLSLRNADFAGNPGGFELFARGTETKSLKGKTDGTLTWNNQPLLPVGIVQAFAGTTIPNGWLLCDGSAVSRTTYANLYACIGDTYGSGDGSTTFNLPNLTDRFIQGNGTVGTVKNAGLPNITGNISFRDNAMTSANGAFLYQATSTSNSYVGTAGTSNQRNANFDASRSSAIYGNSTTVQPPALTMQYIIKY